MLLTLFTLMHVLISLTGIVSGLFVLGGLLAGRRFDRWTVVFLATTVGTSVTGFLFPVRQFMPSHGAGILSLAVLGVAIYARYLRHMEGRWRKAYAVSAVLALYLNVFVAVVQAFLKVPALKVLAPTQTEFPFQATQLSVLVLFIGLGALSAIRFRAEPAPAASLG